MKTFELQAGDNPTLILKSVGGSLRITGKSDAILEIKAHESSDLAVDEQRDRVEITCRSSCTIFAPEQSSFEVGSVGGELFLTGILGQVSINTVGGDARLRRSASSQLTMVGGDFSARGIEGDLFVGRIGGNAQVEQVAGQVELQRVGGDLRISQTQGSVQAEAGGDGVLDLAPAVGSSFTIQVGGDLLCRVPPEASTRFHLQAGGETSWSLPDESVTRIEEGVIQLGSGAAELVLQAGGNLQLDTQSHQIEEGTLDLGEAIATRISAEIEAEMAEIEARLEGMGPELNGIDAEAVNRKIQRAMAKAQRKAEQARRKAQERSRRSTQAPGPAKQQIGIEDLVAGATDQERQMILQMLEAGKITVGEAEMLLKTLEGKA